MNRRDAVLALVALGGVPRIGEAQPTAKKVRRIGLLSAIVSTTPAGQRALQRHRDSLRRVGYEEGKNLVLEIRNAEGNLERLPGLAEDLVRLNVELIVAGLNHAIATAKRATRTIPIVMHFALEPIENIFIETLAHPGGNITGTTWAGPELGGKILQVLKDAMPGAVRIATLFNSTYPGAAAWGTESYRAANALEMSLQEFPISRIEDVVPALDRIASMRPDALVVWGDPILASRAREIAAFASQRRLVSIGSAIPHVDAGGLIFYGPDIAAVFDRTASFVDRILRGAKPGDLPVEGPTKFELVINTKTAQAIGFKPSQSFSQRVDRTVE